MTRKAWRIAGAMLFFLTISTPSLAEQCVSFARRTSGIELRGDAWNWWQAAEGRYQRGTRPQTGAVMVFKPTSKMKRGHVAVVRQVVDSRHIRIDHANWPRGRRTLNAAAVDISFANDWSEVKVTLDPTDIRFVRANPVQGFIYGDPTSDVDAPQILQAQAPVSPVKHHPVTVVALAELPPPTPTALPVHAVTASAAPAAIAPVKAVRDIPPPPARAAQTVIQAQTPTPPTPAPAAVASVTNRDSAAHLNASILARLRGQSAEKILQTNYPDGNGTAAKASAI